MSLTEKDRRQQGLEYNANTKELRRERLQAKSICHEFNQLGPKDISARSKLLFGLFKQSKNPWLEPPFNCDYGYNISMGENFYANHGVVILDAAAVTFGDNVLLGPGVNIATVSHPLNAERRQQGLEVAKPVTLGNNVWVGMGAQILLGVSIGDNAVIAAGAVVNKDVAAGVLVAGVPAKVVRTIEV
jgi:maltose O-acetyltransferase